jgi:hypothetical protein
MRRNPIFHLSPNRTLVTNHASFSGHKKTYANSVDDSDHLGPNEISAISPIDSLGHSSNVVPATTIPYMPVMGYQPYDYNVLLRGYPFSEFSKNFPDGSNGTTTTTTSQSDVSHVNNNNSAIGQVQFGLPWISGNIEALPIIHFSLGGYPSSIPVVQVDPNQYQEMLMQQMRYADVRLQRQDGVTEATTPDGTPMPDKRIPTAIIPSTYPFSGGRFFLVEQPNVRQRKSYKNENR